MSYKIAVASSDHENVDLSFGEAEYFWIYEIQTDGYVLLEKRIWKKEDGESDTTHPQKDSSCGHTCHSDHAACGGGKHDVKLSQVEDCRAVLCAKIGMSASRQLESRAIAAFDVEGKIDSLLEKIKAYYESFLYTIKRKGS